MLELLFVLGLLGVLASVVVVGSVAPEWVLYAGVALIAAGMLLGLPSSAWYHVLLRRALAVRGALPHRWWLHPVPLHATLDERTRGPVLRWFYVGAAFFGLAVLGCALVLISVVRAR